MGKKKGKKTSEGQTPPQEGPSTSQAGTQQQGGPQQGGPQQQSGPRQQGGPQQGGPRQQGGSQQGGPQQGGPRQQGGPQQGGPQQQSGPRQQGGPQKGGPRQQGGPQQGGPRQQGGPQQGGPQQGGPRQQPGPPQYGQQGAWQQRSQQGQPQQPHQQYQQRGPPQQPYQQRGPPQQHYQQSGSPYYQQQHQQRGPPQQQYQQGGSPQYQQQRGPPQQPYQQRGQPQQRGPQQQQRTGPPPQWGPPGLQQPAAVAPPGFPQPSTPKSPPREQVAGPSTPSPTTQKPQQQRQQTPQQQQQPSTTLPALEGGGDALAKNQLVKPGTKGRVIKIESNHLALNVGSLTEAIHYDVTITPDTPKMLLREVMRQFGREHYPNRHPAFDGRKNLYSPKRLPFPGDTDSASGTVRVQGENAMKEFKVEIKFARTVDLTPLHNMMTGARSPQDALQCLDIVLRSAPAANLIIAGRCFFTPPRDQIIHLGEGMEMYYGFYQSAIRGWKPLLNVDVAHKAFPRATEVLDIICELGSDYRNTMTREHLNRPLQRFLEDKLEKFVKQLKIKYEITGQSGSKRIYRVNGLGAPAANAKFKNENGVTSTVDRYFAEKKNFRLRYPHLPTLWVGSRERENKILLPIEFCSLIGGQVVNRKMTENQTSAMIKKAATSTDVRKGKIMGALKEVGFNNDPCVREFGFSVNSQFEQLDARVLEPPKLLYADNKVVKPSRGVWRGDNNKFLTGAVVNKWTVASATRQQARGVDTLAQMIREFGANNGMIFRAQASQPFAHIGGRQSVDDCVQFFKTKLDFDLIFVVVPNSGPQYANVKQAAEITVGCLTQCIKERTLTKLNPQTVGNILLKVNSKLNGTNHVINAPERPLILNRPCMIMGADVTHPSPDARDIPSVAAVTASHDPLAFQYNICWRLQPPKVEIIEDLCNITIEQLRFYYAKTHCKPDTIVFFRDGVSEGQFQQVQRAEIAAIRRACKQVQAEDFEPKITFLVVQKRHHTRLFPRNPRDSEDRNNNVPAGTCVDKNITNPMMQDFYLVSHASIQGVAKPTKYCTLWDDNDMDNDAMQQLTYHLCHLFTRCNRSVSYPAPTYYAHLAAARAKVYIENERLNLDKLQYYQNKFQIQECISKGKPMFFV